MKNLVKFVRYCSSKMMFESLEDIETIVKDSRILRYVNSKDFEYVILENDEYILSCKSKNVNFTVVMFGCASDIEAVKVFKDIVNNSINKDYYEFFEFMDSNYPELSVSYEY